jgi:hypothetical protein
MIDNKYAKEYRANLGFSNQNDVKVFFGAKDLSPLVDLTYIYSLNQRLNSIIEKINSVIHESIRQNNLTEFKLQHIDATHDILISAGILPQLNNQGRRPEQVYYSWMRGYVFSNYFLNALGAIFETSVQNIELIGDDDLKNLETFKRTPKADLQLPINKDEIIRVEMQTGFTGINDIKQHKVLEAKRVEQEIRISTMAIHFDLYNGQVAFIKLNDIEENNMNWITRQQMEGQTVFNIDQNYFTWKLTEAPPTYNQIINYL